MQTFGEEDNALGVFNASLPPCLFNCMISAEAGCLVLIEHFRYIVQVLVFAECRLCS